MQCEFGVTQNRPFFLAASFAPAAELELAKKREDEDNEPGPRGALILWSDLFSFGHIQILANLQQSGR